MKNIEYFGILVATKNRLLDNKQLTYHGKKVICFIGLTPKVIEIVLEVN